ncbi:hypothetical protein [Nonomuraea glycinis]|uniref:hypothetical protein n=1 Tax=Nonomuraea glycinis TaxID=2047744 RepID=UPI002E131AA7|nr:hypothetical protein OHA68_44760 [Nonomuraea glycinis]
MTAVRPDQTGHDFHKGRLARAIVPDQPHNFTGRHVQRESVEGLYRAVPFDEIGYHQQCVTSSDATHSQLNNADMRDCPMFLLTIAMNTLMAGGNKLREKAANGRAFQSDILTA